MKTVMQLIIDKSTDSVAKVVDVSRYDSLMVVVDYVRAASAEGTITFYSSLDDKGLVKCACGIAPVITGTIDADGAVAYTTSTTVAYEIKNVHKYLYIDWSETAAGATISVWLLGKEKR